MPEANRINLRVNPAMFERLDNKRHADKTSFQEVGLAFFEQWLNGAEVPRINGARHNDAILDGLDKAEVVLVEQLISLIRAGDEDKLPAIRMLLKGVSHETTKEASVKSRKHRRTA